MAARPARSRKRSAASSTSPEPLVLFLDECLGRHQVAGALRAAGLRVEVHADHFPEGTDDVRWLAELAGRDWVVLTRDRAMRRKTGEREALTHAGLRVFALTAAGLGAADTAAAFLRALPRIARLCRAHSGPFIARVTRAGQVDILR